MTEEDQNKENIQAAEHKIDMIQRDVNNLNQYAHKQEQILEQLKELANGISKMIAIHEEKHAQSEKERERLSARIEERDSLRLKDIEKLDEKLDRNITELNSAIHDSHRNIINKIDTNLDEYYKRHAEEQNQLAERTRKVEKYVWMGIGGVTVISILATIGNFLIRFYM